MLIEHGDHTMQCGRSSLFAEEHKVKQTQFDYIQDMNTFLVQTYFFAVMQAVHTRTYSNC